MKTVLFSLVLLAGLSANASTMYIVNGKTVSQGEAEDAARKDPRAKIIKVQATYVAINPQTGNFKKFADIDSAELKKVMPRQ